MKNKLILLTTLIAICFSSLQAKKVNERDAKQVAQQLVSTKGNQTRSTSQLTLVHTEFSQSSTSTRSTSSGENVPTYYVFSKGDNKGFVIVSADDVATPILGYSDNGNYDANKLPINFESWMKGISGEIAYAIENKLEQSPETKVAWDSYLSGNLRSLQTRAAVEPFVKTTWDQGKPYKNLCPDGRVTGCVATAMAQIMKYYNYPESSTTTIPGYTTATNKYIIDSIPPSHYDWNNMANDYGYHSTTTTQQQDAVAKLMYHCGVSVKMDYTQGGSGAVSRYVGVSLANYFDYDKSIQTKSHDQYSDEEWENMLIKEMEAKRPVLYSGRNKSVGHAFICDGYDNLGLFHFNWGWSGQYDGYYSTNNLTPASTDPFDLGQEIIINIKPNEGGTNKYELGLSSSYGYLKLSKSTLLSGEVFTVDASLMNKGLFTFSGKIGIAIVDDKDNILKILSQDDRSMGMYSGIGLGTYQNKIPFDLIPGNYFVKIIVRETTETTWTFVKDPATYQNRAPITVIGPTETVWRPIGGSTDWFSGSNWSKGVPGETTKVTISQSTSYPVLTDSAKVDIIYFGAGAELKRHDLLVYNKAFVDYDFGQGERSKHYRTLSFPLKEGYSSDFTFDSQPTVYFKTFKLDPNTQQGKFVTASGSNSEFLTPGSGFMLSVYPDKDPDKGLALSGGILRLPYFDADANVNAAVHPNHEFNASTSESTFYNPARTQSYKATRSADAYRLADELVQIKIPYAPAGDQFMALIGNPFMTTIDFMTLQYMNGIIKGSYQIWTEENGISGYAGYTLFDGYSDGNFGLILSSPLDNYIAPLQGIFVERTEFSQTLDAYLNFSLWHLTADKNSVLRSNIQRGNKINIVADNGRAKVSTFIAKREYGSTLLGDADSRQLINELNEAPQVYTIKACETGNTLVGANITNGESAEYPIGIATTQSGQTSLTFSGMDSYDGNISFTDKVLGRTINLTGLGSYEYTFDYAPKTNGSEVVPTNDRFSLRITSATSSINDPSDFSNSQALVVYTDKGFIHATNSNGATIKEISVYNISGVLVYQASVNASSHTTSQYFKNGVYIVKVKTDSGINHKKVIVK